MTDFDALLYFSFGGPERPEDVMPFLENVTRGRNVPRERLEEVAEHYHHFGGKSPINEQNLALIAALEARLIEAGPNLPIYFGNRNWQPFLADTLRRMRDDGVQRALVFVTSAYGSYSGCRQYRENLAAAVQEVGDGAPELVVLRRFHNHPGFIEANVAKVRDAMNRAPGGRLVFTAHSIPTSMGESSPYEGQLRETASLVAERVGRRDWDLVWQSRSGPPQVPWFEPDILDHLRDLHSRGLRAVVVAPIGFISDHMEVVYDLDHEARDLAKELGMSFERAETAGTHPAFVDAIRELILEQVAGTPRRALGRLGPPLCAPDCCKPPRRPSRPRSADAPAGRP